MGWLYALETTPNKVVLVATTWSASLRLWWIGIRLFADWNANVIILVKEGTWIQALHVYLEMRESHCLD